MRIGSFEVPEGNLEPFTGLPIIRDPKLPRDSIYLMNLNGSRMLLIHRTLTWRERARRFVRRLLRRR